MASIDKEKLDRAVDKCIEASEKLSRIEIVIRGLRNEIDEISTTLFFNDQEDN